MGKSSDHTQNIHSRVQGNNNLTGNMLKTSENSSSNRYHAQSYNIASIQIEVKVLMNMKFRMSESNYGLEFLQIYMLY